MALHTELEIYKVSYDLMDFALDLITNMPRAVKPVVGVKLRQASHSHRDRARLANVVRARGRSVDGKLTKTYWRAA
jgi:hypothetical protein